MASFNSDQAEGLRRMVAGPKPRIFSFLSTATGEEKSAMLVNLSASLAQAGSDVILLDACPNTAGIAARLDAVRSSTLVQLARNECAVHDTVQSMPQGFGVAALTRTPLQPVADGSLQAQQLDDALNALARRADILVVDAELNREDAFAIPALAKGEIIVQVVNTPESITAAYALIKRLNSKLGRRPFHVLVTGSPEKEAQIVFKNMALAANRYLAVRLHSLGSVPADDHVKRATRLGRSVVDAFPLANASVAFRQLAGRFELTQLSGAGLQSATASGMNFGM